MFWENFDYLSRKIGSNPNAVAAECGVKSSGSVSAWKNGTMPQKKTIEKIASYFGISSEELLGEFIPEKQKAPSGMDDAPRRIREALPPRWREIYADLDALHRREVWRQFVERIDIMANRAIKITLKPGGYGFTTRMQQPDGYWIEVIKADK